MNSTLDPERQKAQIAYLQASGAAQTQRNLPGRSGDIEKWRARELYKKAQQAQTRYNKRAGDVNQVLENISKGLDIAHVVNITTQQKRRGNNIIYEFTGRTDVGGRYANEYASGDVLLADRGGSRVHTTKEEAEKQFVETAKGKFGLNENDIIYVNSKLVQASTLNDMEFKLAQEVSKGVLNYEQAKISDLKAYRESLKGAMLESPTAKWGNTTQYAEAFEQQFGIKPSQSQMNSVITPASNQQLELKHKQLQSGTATWTSPEFYMQEVQKMERRGAKVPVDLEKTQPIYGIEGSNAFWTTEAERNRRMISPSTVSEYDARWKEHKETRRVLGMGTPFDVLNTKQELEYKANEEAIWEEKKGKFVSESWYDSLSPIDKGKTLFASSVTDFGVASEYFQSKITGRDTRYKERVYSNIFDKGKKRDPINAAWKVGTGDIALMAAGGVALGAGIKAVKIPASVLKWVGRGATGYMGYSALSDVNRGDYGKAVTESAAFVGSIPYISVGYGLKIPSAAPFKPTTPKGVKTSQSDAFRIAFHPGMRRITEIKVEHELLFKPEIKQVSPEYPISRPQKLSDKYVSAFTTAFKPSKPTSMYVEEYPIFKPVSNSKKFSIGFIQAFKSPETETQPLDRPLGESDVLKIRMDSRIKDLAIKKKLTYDQAFEVLKAKRETYLTEDLPKYTLNRTDYFDDLKVELHRLEAKPKKRINTASVVFGKAEKVREIKEKLEIIQSPEYLQGGSADTFVIKPRTPKTKLIDMSGGKKPIKTVSPFASLLLKGAKIEDFALMDTKQIYRPPTQVYHRPQFKYRGYNAPKTPVIIKSKPINIRFGMPTKMKMSTNNRFKVVSNQGLKPITRTDVKKMIGTNILNRVGTLTGVKTGTGLRSATSTKNALRLRTRELTKTSQKTYTPTRTKTPTIKPPKIIIPRIRIPKSTKIGGVFRSKRGKKTYYGKFKEIAGVISIKQMLKGRKLRI